MGDDFAKHAGASVEDEEEAECACGYKRDVGHVSDRFGFGSFARFCVRSRNACGMLSGWTDRLMSEDERLGCGLECVPPGTGGGTMVCLARVPCRE